MLTKALITLFSRSLKSSIRCYREVKWDAALTVKGYFGDKRLGIDTGCYEYTIGQNSSGVRYEPTSYAILKKVSEYLKFNRDDVFIDYGCGSGRVVFTIATQKLKKIIGIESDKALVDIANANLRKFKFKSTPVDIIHADANNFNPIEGTIIFMFNPFGEKTLQIVLDKIESSLSINPRNIKIIYINSTCNSIMENSEWLELEAVIDDNYSGSTVWRNKEQHGDATNI